ncbi:MAG: radical SAM protein [Spirochaetia bacterium]|nr:radical SAM protein [Spirochaetia bacterium]
MKNTITKRKFEILRLSVTSNCNFSCFYCVPYKKNNLAENKSLNAEEFSRLVYNIHKINPLKMVRITGGEPILYSSLESLIKQLKTMGIQKISMTTNGSFLYKSIDKLKTAGLDEINISLDAVNNNIFEKISGFNNIDVVLKSIEKALEAKISVKLNCTILKNINENQIIPVLEYAAKNKIIVRFLELMKMGHLVKNHEEFFYPESKILQTIREKYQFSALKRNKSSTARYWCLDNGSIFGIIANHSTPFCSDCNRLRMDARGYIYGCLSVNKGFIIENNKENIRKNLEDALSQKQTDYFTGSTLPMKSIGG